MPACMCLYIEKILAKNELPCKNKKIVFLNELENWSACKWTFLKICPVAGSFQHEICWWPKTVGVKQKPRKVSVKVARHGQTQASPNNGHSKLQRCVKPGLRIPSSARTLKANSDKVLCNRQFHKWIVRLNTGPSINKQTVSWIRFIYYYLYAMFILICF